MYNIIEEAIEEQKRKEIFNGDDVVLWRKKEDKFQVESNSKSTWNLIRNVKPITGWWKGLWFTYATLKCVFHT